MLSVLSVAYVQTKRKEKILTNESVTEFYKLLWQNWFLFNKVVTVTELMVSFILYKLWAGAKQIIYVTPFTASLFLMPIWIWWSVNKAYIIIYHVTIVTLFLSTIGNFRFAAYHPLNCSSSLTCVGGENQPLLLQLNLLAVFMRAF